MEEDTKGNSSCYLVVDLNIEPQIPMHPIVYFLVTTFPL
jgi:hypothetical protein